MGHSATALLPHLLPVGRGPSLKTCPDPGSSSISVLPDGKPSQNPSPIPLSSSTPYSCYDPAVIWLRNVILAEAPLSKYEHQMLLPSDTTVQAKQSGSLVWHCGNSLIMHADTRRAPRCPPERASSTSTRGMNGMELSCTCGTSTMRSLLCLGMLHASPPASAARCACCADLTCHDTEQLRFLQQSSVLT